jgi:gluconate 5-dehydrogenase
VQKGNPAFIQDLETQFGGIDILVNNAGIHLKKFSNETTDEEFESIIQTNLLSVFLLLENVPNTWHNAKVESSCLLAQWREYLA